MKHITSRHIGIIGLGDLGALLAMQLLKNSLQVILFDKDPSRIQQFMKNLTDDQRVLCKTASSINDVINHSSLVHFAIPSQFINLKDFNHHTVNQVFVLHDSVMRNSARVIHHHQREHRIAIAHWLMNQTNKVLIADTPSSATAVVHFKRIGLLPQIVNIKDHDEAMALSQGLTAHIINSGVLEKLHKLSDIGFLTPSGEEFRAFLQNREKQWTESTIDSLLTNPHIEHVLQTQKEALNISISSS